MQPDSTKPIFAPTGSPESDTVALSNRMVDESMAGIRVVLRDGISISDMWDQAPRRYLGDHYDKLPPEGIKHVTINKVQGTVIAHVAAETEQAATVRFNPVETQDEPRAVYFKPKASRKFVRMASAGVAVIQGFSSTQIQGIDSINMDQYEVLTGQNTFQIPGQPPAPAMFDPEDFYLVDDKMLCAIHQLLFDRFWAECWGDAVFLENEFNCCLFGSASTLVDWDPESRKIKLTNPHIRNIFIDPICTRIEDAKYVIFDQVMPADSAKIEFPEYATEIDQASTLGSITGYNWGSGYRLGSQYLNTNYQRPMLILRTWWQRDYTRPKTDVEALEDGDVIQNKWSPEDALSQGIIRPHNSQLGMDGEIDGSDNLFDSDSMFDDTPIDGDTDESGADPDEDSDASLSGSVGEQDADPAPGNGGNGANGKDATATPPENPQQTEDPNQSSTNPDKGNPGNDLLPAPDKTSYAYKFSDSGEATHPEAENWPVHYLLKATGEPTHPGQPNWPVKTYVREVRMLKDISRVISDRPTPFEDIPIAWNKSIPIPFSPFGMGEGFRIEDLQQLVNRLATVIFNIVRYGGYPQEYVPQTLLDMWQQKGIEPNSTPGQVMGIPDNMWTQFFANGRSKLGFAVDAPQVSEYMIRLLDMSLKLIDDLGGNVDVLQGQSPSSDTSGKALAILTNNAHGPLALKSRFSELALQRIATLASKAILEFMPDEEWGEYIKSYPPHVLEMIRNEIRCTNWVVDVALVSGRGANREINRSKAIEEFQARLIDLRTALESTDHNADIVIRRFKEQAQQAATAQMNMQQQAQAQLPQQPQPNQAQQGVPAGQSQPAGVAG